MEKIVIIGSSGSGKTTLAQKLRPLLHLNVIYLDRIFWQPSKSYSEKPIKNYPKGFPLRRLFWQRRWKKRHREERMDILQGIITREQWIIDGTYFNSSEASMIAADAIIFLDMLPVLCLLRIVKRHIEFRRRPRRDVPNGCSDKLSFHLILKVLSFPFLERRKLLKKLHAFPAEKVIRLKSPKEVESFLAQLGQHTDKKVQLSPSNVKQKDLILIR